MSAVIAVIPARGGSKRVIGKNLRRLAGKPLLAYTIEAARACAGIDAVVVSTDDLDIANVAREFGADVDVRTPALAGDYVSTIDVLRELFSRRGGYDFVVTLQPTSPLRRVADIDAGLKLLTTKGADAIVSLCRTDPPPQWSNPVGESLNISGFLKHAAATRSQDLVPYYHLNGAIYINRICMLEAETSLLYSKGTFALLMERENSVDIDEEFDLVVAEAMIHYMQDRSQ